VMLMQRGRVKLLAIIVVGAQGFGAPRPAHPTGRGSPH